MANSKKKPPIDFGRTAPPSNDDDLDEAPDPPDEEPEQDDFPAPAPPLAQPVFVGELDRYNLLARYDIRPLTPISPFELQLIMIIAGLENRIRERDPS